MTDSDLPDHLSGGPTIDEANFILGGYSPDEVTNIHRAVTKLTGEIDQRGRDDIRYLILGNYDKQPKQRLQAVRGLLEYFGSTVVAFLLSDLDVENRSWDNFYIKFRYTLSVIDYTILVAEDNDGGHELELGEVSLKHLHILKREYGEASIDGDLEKEKFDAMIAKLFEVMEHNDQLYRWRSHHGLARGVETIVSETAESSLDTRRSLSEESRSEDDQLREEEEAPDAHSIPESWTVVDAVTTVELPNGIEYEIDEIRRNPPDLSEFDEEKLREELPSWRTVSAEEHIVDENADEDLIDELVSSLRAGTHWIQYTREEHDVRVVVYSRENIVRDGFIIEVNGRNSDGHSVATSIAIGVDFSVAVEKAKEFTEIYETHYRESGDPPGAFDRSIAEFES